ncbi:MAG: chromate transporter [Bryobacterales bacterium]|nr:chromate transporter [Bryobacterales bacterium]
MARPSLATLTALYARIGNLTFGGGDPTMAVLQRELVERRQWLTAEQYALAYSLARITPGTNVLAFCAGTAWMIRGWLAAHIAVAVTSLPSAVLAVWLVSAYSSASATPWVQRMFSAVAAAATGMMVAGAVLLVKPMFSYGVARALVIVAGAFAATRAGLSPILVLGLAAVVGAVWKSR